MKPERSYTIWFSQRTGGSLLCKALGSTGVAGKLDEWLLPENLMEHYGAKGYAELQEHLWNLGSTPNRVFGAKYSFHEPHFSRTLNTFEMFPNSSESIPGMPRALLWERAFPNGRHIFMTRRNKVRLAVSWWKAIQTDEWQRKTGEIPKATESAEAYSFDAIHHLCCESVMRECGIQEFLSEAGIIPLTVAYEDLVLDYEGTVKRILEYLEIDWGRVTIAPPYFDRLTDDVSENWTARFREEQQQGWMNRGW